MNAKISCTALKYCVSHGCGDGAEVFTTAMSKFYSGLGLIGSGACAVHESLSVCRLCSMFRITDLKCKKHVEYVYCKSRAFAGAVASMR